MSNPTPITLPTLAEGASLKLTDAPRSNDADFVTKKGRPVDAVCVDHAVVEGGKGTLAVRLLFVVLSGVDEHDADVTGRNIVTDKYLSPGAQPYTFADLRLIGWNVVDGKEIEAAMELADGDVKKSGLGGKVMRLGTKNDTFNNATRIVVADISQPPQRLSAADVKAKLGASLVEAIKKSKDGRPAQDKDAKSGPRNPTSAPPPVQSGGVKDSDPIPF